VLFGAAGTYCDLVISGTGVNHSVRTDISDGTSTIILTDLPGAADAVYYLSVHNSSGNAKLGNVLLGASTSIGSAVYGFSVEDVDYSSIQEDDFGYVTLTQGAWAAKVRGDVLVDTTQAETIFRFLASIRATNCVWIPYPATTYHPLVVYGFRRRFRMSYPSANQVMVSLELRGLV